MPFNIISYKKAIWKGIEGHLKGIVEKQEGHALWNKRGLFERACPSQSYHTKIQYERALKGIWWCDIGRAFTIQERASLWGSYILKRATFRKGHFDVAFIIAFPFLRYVSKKKKQSHNIITYGLTLWLQKRYWILEKWKYTLNIYSGCNDKQWKH